MTEVITIGIDLAKNVFQVHGVDARESRLSAGNSPEQIAGWLKRAYPGEESQSGVARDDLPQSVRSSSRCA